MARHPTLPVIFQSHAPSARTGAQDISISLVVCLDSPVRFLQLCSYFALCLLLLQWRFGGHNVLVSPRPAVLYERCFFVPNGPYKRTVPEHNTITCWNLKRAAFAIISSIMLPAHIVFASSKQYRLWRFALLLPNNHNQRCSTPLSRQLILKSGYTTFATDFCRACYGRCRFCFLQFSHHQGTYSSWQSSPIEISKLPLKCSFFREGVSCHVSFS